MFTRAMLIKIKARTEADAFILAGEEGLEPSIFGARNRRLTNLATRHYKRRLYQIEGGFSSPAIMIWRTKR